MIDGIVDTTVVIHLYRGDNNALTWIKSVGDLGVTPITWMETIYGARGRREQVESLKILRRFQLIYLAETDQTWAMEQLLEKRLKFGVAVNDCLIASVSHRLQVPIYTHNVKDMVRILEPQLVIKPY
jgi:predicted nucleic acid-binding protein